MKKRVFIIVLDSVGIGEAKDAAAYGDEGSNTLLTVSKHPDFHMPNMEALGLFACAGIKTYDPDIAFSGAFGRMEEASAGKDTTTGHWEIAGVISKKPLPTYPNGFPEEVIREFEKRTGRKVLCNKPYSGTEVIRDYGQEHMKSGALIVYTSADSVFQIAAHEDVVPVSMLYEYCETARKMLHGEHNVGRVIARPFTGTYPDFERTSRRHDYSVHPPADTMLTLIQKAGMEVLSVGKIVDIFAGDGITDYARTESNQDGVEKLLAYMERDFEGLCFVNLVDFDMKYGHRNDIGGYARALSEFDTQIPEIMSRLQKEDLLIITADHGCDPGTPSTDHSRENIPVIIAGESVRRNCDLGIRNTFADIAQTVLDYLSVKGTVEGTSMWPGLKKE